MVTLKGILLEVWVNQPAFHTLSEIARQYFRMVLAQIGGGLGAQNSKLAGTINTHGNLLVCRGFGRPERTRTAPGLSRNICCTST